MGVHGSFCQLCRLPLQHDHYVPSASIGMLKIYRGNSGGGGHDWEPDEAVVQFGWEHRWLADAVAITHDGRVVGGTVEDGSLVSEDGESLFIWDGDDEAIAFHRYCHELGGGDLRGHGTHGWAVAETYAGQLFEMREFVDHGKAWALVDPTYEPRSRARIHAIREGAKRTRLRGRISTVAQIIEADRDWQSRMLRTEDGEARHVIRCRDAVHPEIDCAEYPILVWAMLEYGTGMPDAKAFDAIETFEVALKAAVEPGAILLMTTIGEGQGQFLMHARDEAATVAAIEALPRPLKLEFDNERDPTWNVYFSQMAPRR